MCLTRSGKVVGCLVLLFLVGCGGNDGSGARLVPVSGRVVFKNQPAGGLELYFMADAKKGNQGDMGGVFVQEDGGFTVNVAPGAYKVKLGIGRRRNKDLIKYHLVQTTPLSIEVPDGGLDDVLIDLDKGRVEVK